MSQQYIDFAFVKEHASFARVLDHYGLQIVGRGAQRAVLCPFHRETKPSCKVHLKKGVFHCFGCETAGNLLDFVAKLDDGDLRSAAIKIAEICGIALAPPGRRADKPPREPQDGHKRPGTKPSSAPQTRARRAAASTDEPINPPLTFTLKLDPTHPYLAERGLSAEVVNEFGLGYCSRGVMGGRICVPLHNERGELIGYAGRWPGDPVPDDQERYLLPAKFRKRLALYNLHRVHDAEHVVLVEGYFSAVRIHILGFPVAALMGWSVSPEQIALLVHSGTRFVTLLLDGDEAGRRAREKVLPELASAFFVRAPVLPEGEKPDTLLEAELRKLVRFPNA